ncbi:hypothetical protein HPK01_11235 [Anoxybacillus flavithermus]|uniref:restriction endonuclease subunit S n=1 Tax=Anoxybacillus flavithermus TaxID=33934 RepID=UPI001867A975|nr:hypothetical protein [Anoxybacillus flavithermus]
MGETKFITAEIGVLPEGWKLIDIKSIADRNQKHSFIDGDWIEAKYIENNGIRLIQTGNIGIGHFIEKETKKYISEKTFHELNCKEVKPGDILICRLAAPIGRACIAPDLGTKAITAVDVVILKVNQNEYSREYINYYLNFEKTLQRMESFASGSTRQRISRTNLGNVLIAIPPLAEQRKIAAILSSVDEAIEKTKAIIEQTEKVKKGLMQQLLTKGIGHTKFKKTEIGEIPEEWEVVKINDIFERVTRNNDFKDNYPVLTISAKEGFVDQKERFNRVIAGKSLEKYVLLHKGEFAYNRGNSKSYPFGVTYKLNDFEKGLVPFVYFSFRKRNNIECNLDFYQYYFLSHKLDRQLRKIITSSARQDGLMNISADEFFNLLIPFPPKSEQEEIAKYIESVGKRIKRERKKFELLNLVKKALMQVLLTGKVRVKVEDEVMSQ